MTKRFLRLKEHQPSQIGAWETSQDYLDRTDGSLRKGTFEYKTLDGGFLDTGNNHDDLLPSVFLVGDSFVESSFTEPERRFSAQLDKLVKSHNIVNSGYSGTTTLQAVLLILGKIPVFAKKGDTVLLFVPKSDANAFPLEGGYWNSSRTYSPIVPADFETQWTASDADFASLIGSLSIFLKGIGLNFLIATSPHRNGDFSSDSWLRLAYRRNRGIYEKRVELRDLLDQSVRRVSMELGIPLLDLSNEFSNTNAYFYDELHLNSKGQEDIVPSISTFLESNL